MELFDTHCHLDLPAFDEDRQQVLTDAAESHVQHILVPATESLGWDALLELCATNDSLYPALGLHPVMLERHQAGDLSLLETYLNKKSVSAVGEIGLDFFIKSLNRENQIALFDAQLKLAEQFKLPVVLHVRKAHDVVLQMLKKHHLVGGFCHAFNGSLQQANQYIDLGFKLGFGGMLTYPNANKLRGLASKIPLESIVLETDAPDMTGIVHQYQRNSPAYLIETAEVLAQIKHSDVKSISQQTTSNAFDVLDISV